MARVEPIHIAAEHEQLPLPVDSVRAVAGKGLEGDRQYGRGDITLIEAEALEALASEQGIELAPGESRRQITTRGIALTDLVGERFRVGEVECVGTELCEPCRHLESLTQPGASSVPDLGDAALYPPAPAGLLPDRVWLRSTTDTMNRRWYFATREGRIYFKPNVERAGTDGPWRELRLPACFAGDVQAISTDDDEMLAVDQTGRIYTMDSALSDPA